MGWLFPDPVCPACGVTIDNVSVFSHHIYSNLCGSCGNKRVSNEQTRFENSQKQQ